MNTDLSTIEVPECPLAALRFIRLIKKTMHRLQIDKAVVYGIFPRIWALFSGPVTLILIATHFTLTTQGYYYTFNSLLAMQVFAELGLGTVVVQFASHEWSSLSLDKKGLIVGDKASLSRMASLMRLVFRWYFVGGIVVAVGLSCGGYFFFRSSAGQGFDYTVQWVVLSMLSGINFCIMPVWFLLEGCNQVANVNAYRGIQGVLSTLSIWAAIFFGAGLWALVVSVAVCIVWALIFIWFRYRRFFLLYFSRSAGSSIAWHGEMWPMQWRLALGFASGYFANAIFTPILFHYCGAEVAGQMGMTMNLANTIAVIASVWYTSRAPRFGMLVAKKNYEELDALFYKILRVHVLMLCLGALTMWLIVFFLYNYDYPFSQRLLPPLTSGILLIGMVAANITGVIGVYLRAHKKEPLMVASIVIGIMTGLASWLLGIHYAALGVVIGYMGVSLLVSIPWCIKVWLRCKSVWHGDAITAGCE